jgi:hypothetical protein
MSVEQESEILFLSRPQAEESRAVGRFFASTEFILSLSEGSGSE